MIALEMLERGFSKAGPRSKCEGCPFAGSCTPCRPQTGEFGKKVLTVNSLEEVSPTFKGIITFNPVRQEDGKAPINKFVSNEIRTGEKTCAICQEAASNCLHSGTSK